MRHTWAHTIMVSVFMSFLPSAQSYTWSTFAPLIQPRQEVGAAQINGKIYVAGGFLEDRTTANTVEVYDTKTGRWSTIDPMPIAVNHPAAVASDGKLYIIGGFRGGGFENPTDALQVYDPSTREWTLKTPMPSARGGLAGAIVMKKIYAVGGARGLSVGEAAFYDPMTDSWTIVASLSTSRDHLGAGVVTGRIFAVGGRDERSFTLTTVEAYNPSTDRWEQQTPMPTGRSGHAVAVINSCLYVFGGEGSARSATGVFDEVEVFNALAGNWFSVTPMPTPRHGLGAVSVGNHIYLPAGATVAGFGATNVHEALVVQGCD